MSIDEKSEEMLTYLKSLESKEKTSEIEKLVAKKCERESGRTTDTEPVHPNYYKGNSHDGKSIEVFDIVDQFVGGDFYLGNVLKYVCRAGKKSKETKRQDLEKALHYIKEAIKRL